jgi:uncharacterized protein YdaU (DUF1376 family)
VITAKAAQQIQKERRKMDTELQDFYSKRQEEVQQQIKAQEQTIAREAELKNKCAGMEKTVMDGHIENHEYEFELCEKRF